MVNKKPRAGKKPVRPVVAVQPPVPGNFLYGRDWGEMNPLQIEPVCFLSGLSVADGGLGKAQHFWNVVAMLWPATSRFGGFYSLTVEVRCTVENRCLR